MNQRELQRMLDKIAGSRISKIGKGIPIHVALSNRNSITLRNKLMRMNLHGSHVDQALKMVDEIGIQNMLENQSLATKFSTIAIAKRKPNVWKPKE